MALRASASASKSFQSVRKIDFVINFLSKAFISKDQVIVKAGRISLLPRYLLHT